MYSINRFLSHLNRLLKKKLSYEIFQIIEHITKPYYSPRFYSRKTESILYPLQTFQNEQRDSKIQHHSTSKLRLEEKTVRKLTYSESSTKALFFFFFFHNAVLLVDPLRAAGSCPSYEVAIFCACSSCEFFATLLTPRHEFFFSRRTRG